MSENSFLFFFFFVSSKIEVQIGLPKLVCPNPNPNPICFFWVETRGSWTHGRDSLGCEPAWLPITMMVCVSMSSLSLSMASCPWQASGPPKEAGSMNATSGNPVMVCVERKSTNFKTRRNGKRSTPEPRSQKPLGLLQFSPP